MNKKILVVLGHANSQSLCSHLANTYVESAKNSGHSVDLLRLGELKFDPIFRYNYNEKEKQPLEKDLAMSQDLIQKAEHIVFIFPSYWASMPALLKGWIDRVFLPGFAFKYNKSKPLPDKLLKGKTARIIITMDAPSLWYKFINGAPGLKLLKIGTLEFCGIKPVKSTILDSVRGSSPERITKLINSVEKLGLKGE
jgi:NAD(P)H dehydrogenase (quinone)